MVRVKRGILKNKRKKKILKLAKGFRNARSTKYKQAKQGVIRAGQHAFAHRRKKKREMRKHWQILISSAVKNLQGISYSQFMDMATKKEVGVDRKIMAAMIMEDPASFGRLVEEVTGNKNTGEIPAVATGEKKEVKKSEKKAPAKATKKEEKKSTPKKEAAKAAEADDLTKIEGIGPKIAETLVAAGVATFADLAKEKAEKISGIISEVRGSHDPETWPKQAQMAADGEWDKLKALQDEMDGGKA